MAEKVSLPRKPRMMKKLLDLVRYLELHGSNGHRAKGFILNASNKCNFRCQHCYTRSGKGEFGEERLSVDDIRSLANQADALGVYEIDIQGGEPLLNPKLFDILQAIDTSRFYIYITSNGYLLDKDMAHKLAQAGIDRVSVSIDAFTPEEHDAFRGVNGAYAKAIEALENTQAAGMAPYVNIVVGHYNAQSKELADFVNYLEERHFGIAFNCAAPTGNWRGNYDVMLTEDDSRYLEQMRSKHKGIIRDLWNYFDPSGLKVYGCPAVNLFYVNPLGDILPCPYIHTKLGNLHDDKLSDILARGFNVKWFNDYSAKCLVGENTEFAKKFLDNEMKVLSPIDLQELFGREDFINAPD